MALRSRARLLPLLSLVACLARASSAHAEPTEADRDRAREFLRQGYELRDKGDHAAALDPLTKAHALVVTPITTQALAKEHAEVGHLVEARALALSVEQIPVAAGESPGTQTARRQAAELAESLQKRVASITVVLANVAPDRRYEVTIDGVAKSPPTGEPYLVNPGSHVVTGRVDGGAPVETELTLVEGDAKIITMEPLPPPKPPPEAPREPATESGGARVSPLVFAGFGVATVGIAAGTVTGLVALDKAGTSECDGNRCTAAGIDDIDSGRMLALVSTVSFAVAVAGLGVGVYGLTLGAPKRAAWQLAPSLGGGVLRGTF